MCITASRFIVHHEFKKTAGFTIGSFFNSRWTQAAEAFCPIVIVLTGEESRSSGASFRLLSGGATNTRIPLSGSSAVSLAPVPVGVRQACTRNRTYRRKTLPTPRGLCPGSHAPAWEPAACTLRVLAAATRCVAATKARRGLPRLWENFASHSVARSGPFRHY